MEKIIYDVIVDSKDAVKNIEKINDALKDTEDIAGDASKEVGDVGKAAKKSKGGFKSMSTGIKAVGTALKAAGIGLVIALVAGLTEAFSRNKRIMDAVGLVMGTVQEVFSQITNALITIYDSITSTNENFDAMGRIVGNLITIVLNPLKMWFFTMKGVLESYKLVWEKAFGDDESVAKAQAAVDATKQTVIDLGKEVITAGKAIGEDFSEAVSEISTIGTTIVKELGKVSVETATKTASAYQDATNGAILAQAEAGRLVAQYETQAELQRQLRDDTSLSIEERTKANKKLAEILDEQEKAMLKQADAVIAGARAELLKNDSIENQAALVDALAQKDQVRNDIAGKRSEQLVNEVALLKEKGDLENTISEGVDERNRKQAEFDAETEEDPLLKLQKQKDALDLENEAILEDLERKRELYAEGTQARIDAEEDYKNKKQDIDNSTTKNANETAKLNIKIAGDEAKAKLAALDAVGSALTAMSDLAGKETAAGKALAIAASTISVFTGIASIWGNPSDIGPTPIQIATKIAGSIAVAASGFAAIKNIVATKVPTKNGGGAGGTMPNKPTFNVVGQSAPSVDSQSEVSAQELDARDTTPQKAYVVSTDITSQQALDREIEGQSTLG